MKIDKVEAIAIEVPLPKPFAGATYTVPTRNTVITRIHTDDGLVSEVFNGDNRKAGVEVVRIIHEQIAPLILGEDPMAHEAVWEKAFQITKPQGDRKLLMEAVACVDTAVWDIKGKAVGVSVNRLMGGYRQRIPITATGGYYQEGRTIESFGEEMKWQISVGMGGCKFKVGGLSPEEDYERVASAREGAGPDYILGCDANQGWTVDEAVRFAELVEPLNITWFEEPVRWQDDVRSMAELRKRISIPINAGQSEITSWAVRRLLDAGAVDIVNFDMSHGGGPTEWLRAATMCHSVGVKMLHHEETHLAVHALAAVPHGLYTDCFPDPDRDPIWANMILNRPKVADGYIEVPQGPGFDIQLDWDAVKKYTIS
ncbi:MAG: mandelate racemase/muconate lactonizing enzyme family protein [Proteobacteria bacterium]|nr:mandelate racemase/muconate lactonizing enzyme family protein [Pseudomonadota bacterium]